MNNKAVTLSLIMAALAVFFVYSYVSSIEEETNKRYGTEILVLQATRDIKEMETVDEKMIGFKRIPKKFKEPAAIAYEKLEEDKETSRGLKDLVGSVALVPINKGEQITLNKLTEPNMRTGLSPQVTPGRRAVAIPVNEVTGVSKLVKPGDRVDVVAVLDAGGGKMNKLAKTVLQDVVVLSVGRAVSNNVARTIELDTITGTQKIRNLNEDLTFNSVTLEVEPGQAQALALVVASGDASLTLTLRNNDDTDRANLGAVSYDDVLGPEAQRFRQPAGGKR